MSLDIEIGFEKEPIGLGKILDREGYAFVEHIDDSINYEHRQHGWPQVFYFSNDKAEDCAPGNRIPNWEAAGFKVVSSVNINYPHSGDSREEAERLSDLITKELDGIKYDYNLMDFYTKEDI